MQLVAYGAQDIYLTGNPQITFFKVVYRRHTNFSMETILQTINGTSTLTSSATTGNVTISRNGDLVHKVYVTSSSTSIEDGTAIISDVTLEIGGQQIDKHYKEWNQIWEELSTPESKSLGLSCMQCGFQGLTTETGGNNLGMVQIPLQFWFCRNPGLALPLIALQYHEVKLKFTWGTSASPTASSPGCGAEADVKVWSDYIYLDTDERRRFAQVSHEYLIEQVQKQSLTATTSSKLNFNHPVKELIWTSAATNAYGTAKVQLNGHDRFAYQEEEYFQLRQPYDYHTSVPQTNLPEKVARLVVPQLQVLDSIEVLGSKSGIVYSTNVSTTEALVDADVNGFSPSDSDGTTPTTGAGGYTSCILPTETFAVATGSGQNSYIPGRPVIVSHVDTSATMTPNLTLTTIKSANSATGILQFTDTVFALGVAAEVTDSLTILGLPFLSTLNIQDSLLNITAIAGKVGRAWTSDLATTESANDSTANAFSSTSSDGSADASAATDGKQVIIDADTANITAGDLHLVVHCAVTLNGGVGDGIMATYATVSSFAAGLLIYDRQITTLATTVAAKDHLAIFKVNRNYSRLSSFTKKINVYSFALKPEEHQPSGTCNFSRIDNAKLMTTTALAAADNIYAVNYNILRIMSGMGGLAYSN